MSPNLTRSETASDCKACNETRSEDGSESSKVGSEIGGESSQIRSETGSDRSKARSEIASESKARSETRSEDGSERSKVCSEIGGGSSQVRSEAGNDRSKARSETASESLSEVKERSEIDPAAENPVNAEGSRGDRLVPQAQVSQRSVSAAGAGKGEISEISKVRSEIDCVGGAQGQQAKLILALESMRGTTQQRGLELQRLQKEFPQEYAQMMNMVP
jgi:hypothetical protein